MLNPLVRSLPELLIVVLDSMPALAPAVDLLFAEAFSEDLGRQAAVNRLAEYVILLLLRNAASMNLIQRGTLVGLADPRIAKVISAIHQGPEQPWTLEALADAPECHGRGSRCIFAMSLGALPSIIWQNGASGQLSLS